ncbi:MAG TPA: hypothetical protein VHL52_00180 [Acidimicrobiia bacterium]|nr:hypothetical protein [Acidimicrobiia bacterium]
MPVRTILVLIVALAATLPAAAAEPSVEAQGDVSLSVDLGVGGFTQSGRPSEVSATISSPVLISGRLRVRGADIAVSRPIEVPAGGEQTYQLLVPPLPDATRLTVEVLDGDGERVTSTAVTTRVPGTDEMAVGVMGDPELVELLGRVRTIITDRPVAAFEIPVDVPAPTFDVLDYLVVGGQATDGVQAALDWAVAGGTIVIDASEGAGAELSELTTTGVTGVTRGTLGAGTVIVVESLDGRSAEDWAAMLRPTPLDFTNSPEWGMGDPQSLLQAASEAGTRQVPSIPWLLFAIIGFALLVGPVNFIVLSRLRKRDWAWVSIPTMAIIAVVAFWVAGRQRIAGTNLTHASVIVAEGGIEARSAVLVAAGVAGERRLSFGPEYRIFPERSLFGSGGAELRIDGENLASVELEQLGFTGVGVATSSPGLELPSATVEDGQLRVDNSSGITFWGWGVMAAGSSSVANTELGPGSVDTVPMPRGQGGDFGFNFVDALINRRQLWDDPARSNGLWPLSQVVAAEVDADGVYFVGLTDEYQPQVTVGGVEGFPGSTLVIQRVDTTPTVEAGEGQVGAVLVDTGFINWLDWGVQKVISSEEITVRFDLPDPSLSVRLVDAGRFGVRPEAYEAWNWSGAEFEAIDPAEPVPPSAVSSDGQVYVRLLGANEFGDNPMSPADLSLTWET